MLSEAEVESLLGASRMTPTCRPPGPSATRINLYPSHEQNKTGRANGRN